MPGRATSSPEPCALGNTSPLVSTVFGFVQTLTGCEDQARLFKDEVGARCRVGTKQHHCP